MVQKAGCVLVNQKERKVGLIYRKKLNDYSFPKGHIEKGETAEEGAIRETIEETGRNSKIILKLPSLKYVNNIDKDIEILFFLAIDTGQSNKTFEEDLVHDLIWLDIDDVEKTLTYEDLKKYWNGIKMYVKEVIDNSMWQNRLNKILDKKLVDKIKNTTVLIIGLGGVGGHALESIVRMGVNNIIIVDGDIIDITNLNRQLLSLKSNIGKRKVDVAKKRIFDINSDCNVTAIPLMIDENNISTLFKYNIDYVIDACDTVTTKILLIKECLEKNIKIISSMGTGNKFHPELLEITELKKTNYDPLAKIIRNKFKDEKRKIMVVSSKEKGISINDRTPGSTSLVPSTAGILCASFVINDILNSKEV